MDPLSRLQMQGAHLLVSLRERCRTSQTALTHVIDGVTDLLANYCTATLDILTENNVELAARDQVRNVFENILPPSEVFSPVNTRHRLDAFLVQRLGMIMPLKVLLGSTLKQVHKPTYDVLLQKHYFYYVPIIDKLKVLLQNEDIRRMVDSPYFGEEDFLASPLDGSYYQENEFFKENQKLVCGLYSDGLGVTCALKSRASTQKITIFYWSLLNMWPKVRSNLNAVFLLAIARTSFLKKYGASAVLDRFKEEMAVLQTTGVNVDVNGVVRNYKGSLLIYSGDNPAAAEVQGLKESVAANKPCRACLTDHEGLFSHFDERFFVLRNLETHAEHLEAINDPDQSAEQRSFWQRFYGVNSTSSLFDLRHWDVIKCCVQDAMHVILEGSLSLELWLLLQYMISHNVFSLNQFNSAIECFNFGYFGNDRPSPVLQCHLDSSIKQSAAQMLSLCYCLPFLIGKWLKSATADVIVRFECFLKLSQIVNLTLAYKIRKKDTYLLSRMIESHHRLFAELYPGRLTPKFHFLIHIPRQIREFGPCRQTWCMRYEGAHAPKKTLVPVVRNFKNMSFTLAYRTEALSAISIPTLFPSAADAHFGEERIRIADMPSHDAFCAVSNLPEHQEIIKATALKFSCTTVKGNDLILLNSNVDTDFLPSFGVIVSLYVHGDDRFVGYQALETMCYSEMHNAFEIRKSLQPTLNYVNVKNLEFPHFLPTFVSERSQYVVLLYHCRTEFYG